MLQDTFRHPGAAVTFGPKCQRSRQQNQKLEIDGLHIVYW